MFNNPTLAFFFNNVGGFVSVIVISLIISEIFRNKKETFINLPLLASTIFISMPMIVFQQSKDMKLDAGLFFVGVIALYMIFDFYKNYKDGGVKKEYFLSQI
jgi:4-hydroxybenzoate polyprenyltransferase